VTTALDRLDERQVVTVRDFVSRTRQSGREDRRAAGRPSSSRPAGWRAEKPSCDVCSSTRAVLPVTNRTTAHGNEVAAWTKQACEPCLARFEARKPERKWR
jgi:hypothetical protein